jgi:hypothetical protein
MKLPVAVAVPRREGQEQKVVVEGVTALLEGAEAVTGQAVD